MLQKVCAPFSWKVPMMVLLTCFSFTGHSWELTALLMLIACDFSKFSFSWSRLLVLRWVSALGSGSVDMLKAAFSAVVKWPTRLAKIGVSTSFVP
uniref:Putative secreted protein n=1 Tax=Ixodes ricinus TaxID=34613 RepID=A0A6B0U3K3_IXORI